ncbi:hypothetical protein G7046_g2821 [Stylonectria norvegica]|nr:hypothetical protein G7046_g2821 [Stylonectria norvegica]
MLPPSRPTDPYDVPISPHKPPAKSSSVEASSSIAVAKEVTSTETFSEGAKEVTSIEVTRETESIEATNNDSATREADTATDDDPTRDDTISADASNGPETEETQEDNAPTDDVSKTNGSRESDDTNAREEKEGAEDEVPAASGAAATHSKPAEEYIEMEIDSLESHRVDKNAATVDFKVKWASGEYSWEPEWSLQGQVPTMVFEYWDQFDSREEATDLGIFHVFRILKRTTSSKGNQSKYLIQWVGYRRTEATWEPEKKVREMAPMELDKFEAKNISPKEIALKKRAAGGRGPGRPRKKAKTT